MSKDKPVYGLDLSAWQKGLSIASLRKQDYHWVCLRATGGLNADGSIFLDESYDGFSEAARNAGMVQGAYLFLVEKPAKQQVDAFIRVVGTLKDKFVMLDFEAYGPNPRYSPTNATLRAVIAELRNRGIHKPLLIYSGKGYWQGGTPSGALSNYGNNLIAWDAAYPLGLASSYGSVLYEDALKYGWGMRWGGVEPEIWQFTGYGKVDGYAGDVDINAARVPIERIREYTLPATSGPDTGTVNPPPSPPHTQPGTERDNWPEVAPAKEPTPPPRPGNYLQRHPTRYQWRPDVEDVVFKLFNRFRRISINTYHKHPGAEITGDARWANRDTSSFDVWARQGRGYPIERMLGNAVVTYLMTDPEPPLIDWIIFGGKIWSRGTGRWSPYGGGDKFMAHMDHVHCTLVGPARVIP